MTEYLSHKLRVLSGLLILMVLYIHMYYTEGNSMLALLILEKTIGGSLCSVAVPMFYAISGYLFFVKTPDGVDGLIPKMGKRCRTLLVPYLMANVLTFVFYAGLNVVARHIPAIDSVLNFKVLDTFVTQGLWPTLQLVFINPPIAFQLWFVRDLMVVVLFSPLIYLALLRASSSTTIANILLSIILIGLIISIKLPFIIATSWFTLGGIVAMRHINLSPKQHNKTLTATLLIIYCSLCVLNGQGWLPKWLIRLIPIVGIPALWYAYDVIVRVVPGFVCNKTIGFATKYTFFVYLCHEPLLNIFKKLPLLVSRSEPTYIAAYLFIPPLFYVIACVVGYLAKRILPKFYALYTGGR